MCNTCGTGCTPVVTGPHVERTQDVHGIPDTSKLETKSGALNKSAQAAEKALIQAKQYVDSKLKGGTPGGGGGDGTWETPEGAQAKVDEHSKKTRDVHGIKDTAKLVTEDEVGAMIDAIVADAIDGLPGGGGGGGDDTWETPEGAQEKVDEHAEKTRDVHGIADTGELVTKEYMRAALAELPTGGGEGGGDGGGGTWETPMAAQEKADRALSDAKAYTDEHAEKTTDVHGIKDTADLATKADLKAVEDKIPADGGGEGKEWETPEGAQAKVDAHAEKTKDVHGIADTTLLVTVEQLKAVEDRIPADGGGGGGEGDGKTWETPEAAQEKADKALTDSKAYTDEAVKKHVDTYHAPVTVDTGVTVEEGWAVAAQEMRSVGGVHTVFIELERTGEPIAGKGIAVKAKDGMTEAGNIVPDMKIGAVPAAWGPPKRLMVDTHSGYTSGSVRITPAGDLYLADLTPENPLRTGQHLVFSYEFIKPVGDGSGGGTPDPDPGTPGGGLSEAEVQKIVEKAVADAMSEHVVSCHTLDVITDGVTVEPGWEIDTSELRVLGGVTSAFLRLKRTGDDIESKGPDFQSDGKPSQGNIVPDLKIATVTGPWVPPQSYVVSGGSSYGSGTIRVEKGGGVFLLDWTFNNPLRKDHLLRTSWEFLTESKCQDPSPAPAEPEPAPETGGGSVAPTAKGTALPKATETRSVRVDVPQSKVKSKSAEKSEG